LAEKRSFSDFKYDSDSDRYVVASLGSQMLVIKNGQMVVE
jgi:hypothetical protein